MTHVLVWYENRPLPEAAEAEKHVYPEGIHGALSALMRTQSDLEVRAAVMQEPAQGLADEALAWSLAGLVGHDQRSVDGDDEAGFTGRVAQDRGDLVVRAHRARSEQPAVLREHRHARAGSLAPGEVDARVAQRHGPTR